jgi:hypothetical protein
MNRSRGSSRATSAEHGREMILSDLLFPDVSPCHECFIGDRKRIRHIETRPGPSERIVRERHPLRPGLFAENGLLRFAPEVVVGEQAECPEIQMIGQTRHYFRCNVP